MLEVRLRASELQFASVREIGGRRDFDDHLTEHKVAVSDSAWPFRWQRIVWQHIQSQRGHSGDCCLASDRVRRIVRIRTARQKRAVLLSGELHVAVALDFQIIQRVQLQRLRSRFRECCLCLGFPGSESLSELGLFASEFRGDAGQLGIVRGFCFFIGRHFFGRLRNDRRFLIAVVERGEELVVLALADRIVFVRVTASTTDGQSQPNRARCFRAVKASLDAPLFLVRATFGVGQRLPVKGRREFLHRRPVRQQVAGDLLDGELIEGHVIVDRVDDPISPAVRIGSRVVLFVAVAVRVASHVEPVPPPTFSEVRRLEQPIDEFLVGVRPRVAHE